MNADAQSPAAVEVRDAVVTYGQRASAYKALRGVNIRVPEGVIYGLLGPSGCGKTTLLSSVVGGRTLTRGNVLVFGCRPGTRESRVPGSWVGYMPQGLALYPEFTIEETLTYFGRLHNVDATTIRERTAFLLMFLDLPYKDRMISALSGGQKRRVSFAAALIHKPPLLILDEPTVGVDPLLRQSIWNYLVRLTTSEGVTVIITTHYIEEARQANVVGLMRKGRVLVEASPENLINSFRVSTLEDCFFRLCMLDKTDEKQDSNKGTSRVVSVTGSDPSFSSMTKNSVECFEAARTLRSRQKTSNVRFRQKTNCVASSALRTYALTAKNIIRLRRSLVVLFQFILPILQVNLLCSCIGHPPLNLPLAVVNREVHEGIGSLFLQMLDNQTIQQIEFSDLEYALRSVKDGVAWGALEIGPDFSISLLHRFAMGLHADNSTVEASTIRVFLDMTNQQIGVALQVQLYLTFQKLVRELLLTYGGNPALAQLPVVVKPIYGSSNPSFTEFFVPGIVLSIIYIMAVGMTALSFVDERKSGMLKRSWVSGATPTETLLSYVITQSIVLVIQVALLLVFTFLVYKVPFQGPLILITLLVFLQGCVGMAYGLFVSSLVNSEGAAIMIALGSFYPNLIMSGIVWPIEGMDDMLMFVSYCLPQTLATKAMRSILGRGLDFSRDEVWMGFFVTLAWFTFFLVAAAAIFRIRR